MNEATRKEKINDVEQLLSKNFSVKVSGVDEVYLKVGVKVPEGISAKQSMAEVYYETATSENLLSESQKITAVNLIPSEFGLKQNFPNPFNPSTTVAFDLPQDVTVSLEIFDITGRKIRSLINEPRTAGTHQVVWNGQDDHSNSVGSSLYVYRIQAGDFVQSKKMLFMK